MGNSITTFSKRLKIAYNDKKKLIKESGGKYSKEEFAKKVYGVGTDGKVHVDRVNKWFQGKNFPSPDLIPEIAKELDCDIAYLFGEIECKHCKEQQITDITGLSEEASASLIEISKDEQKLEALNDFINNSNFESLLNELYLFAHSHNKTMTITDIYSKHKSSHSRKASDVYRTNLFNIFTNLISDIYSGNTDTMNKLVLDALALNIKKNVDYKEEILHNGSNNDYQSVDDLIKLIDKSIMKDTENIIKIIDADNSHGYTLAEIVKKFETFNTPTVEKKKNTYTNYNEENNNP